MNKKVTLAQLQEVVQEAYDQVKTNTGGKNADYIPLLGQCQQRSLWNQCLPAQRTDHPCGGYRLPLRNRIRIQSTYGYPGSASIWR